MFPKVTLIYKYDEKAGGGQDQFTGYLIDQEHAMYLTDGFDGNELELVRVTSTEKPDVYNIDSGFFVLGIVAEEQTELVIHSLAEVLKTKSAYDFLTCVMVNVADEVNFGELIIPGFINSSEIMTGGEE